MTDAKKADAGLPKEPGLASRMWLGLALVILLCGSVVGWAATSTLTGAVIASGVLVIDSSAKKVQHPTGGIVGELYVREGDVVRAGDVVLKLDEVQTRAGLGIVMSQLTELKGRKVRLTAEGQGLDTMDYAETFLKSDPNAPQIADGEKRLFLARLSARRGQIAQLQERVAQFKQEIEGLTAQREAKDTEIKLIGKELKRLEELRKQSLVPVTRLLAMQRERTQLEGERGSLTSQIARAEGQISETGLQMLSVEQNAQSDAQKELRDIESRIAELEERRIAAEDQLNRIELRSPVSGVVHQLAVHTVGGVISPAETVMMIVPVQDALAVEVRVNPTDIDQIAPQQKAVLKFAAFNQQTTPEVNGTVSRIAPDLSKDPQTGQPYYLARIHVDKLELTKLKELRLVPGMPVETFIETGQRTALSYFAKPFLDQLDRTFREN